MSDEIGAVIPQFWRAAESRISGVVSRLLDERLKNLRPGGAHPICLIIPSPAIGFQGFVPIPYPFEVVSLTLGGLVSQSGSATVDIAIGGVSIVDDGATASGSGVQVVSPTPLWTTRIAGGQAIHFYIQAFSGAWSPFTFSLDVRAL